MRRRARGSARKNRGGGRRGQGSLTLSRLLGEAALAAGLDVTVSEIHGMSQRGGVVTSAVMIGGLKSPIIGAGDADVLVAFEPVEALRAAALVSRKTVVVVNVRKNVPFGLSLSGGAYPDVMTVLNGFVGTAERLYAFDATSLAEQAGSALAANVVLLGALARTGCLPIEEEALAETIRQKRRRGLWNRIFARFPWAATRSGPSRTRLRHRVPRAFVTPCLRDPRDRGRRRPRASRA
ncbi:MAG: 2-oxoacid:acceptor oxidoreductase family protein [Deltaproteobacteria bacterium]|nr:2-oxoacid:acceptor oxidoreductase family protein [Deltaproteobacteria bacterium]